MTKLFFDIETIPCADEDKARFVEILKKKNGNALKKDDDLFTGMSFNGAFGRICCIGYIKESEGQIIDQGVLDGDEKTMLTKFWEIAADVQRFIGHNIYDFDFPFMYKRSILNNVKPRELSFARYRNVPIFDTMREWDLWSTANKPASLDFLAQLFNLPTSKDEMDGSKVWPNYQEGKMEEIKTYCMKDVVLSRQVYYRMICEEISAPNQSSEDIPF
jgi:3'-5' exonuclease